MNDESSRLLPYIFFAFPVFFVALWLGVTVLISHVSGWRALAGRFAGRPAHVDGSASMASGRMGYSAVFSANFNSILTVRVGRDGVGLALFRLFAATSPPLLLPWEALRECRSWKLLGTFDRFRFEVADTGVGVTLNGRAAVLVRDAWFRWGAAAGATVAR
ncbi:MAG TPA: hypothetical protein VFQ39_20150 [Longimicrobium sp.]|nr:hypothetical protein [Longimicrobium sp.]